MTSRRTHLFLSLSLLLLLSLCFALLPAQALAAGDFDTPRELEVLSESPAPVFRSSGEITVYFTDALNWGTPCVHYWSQGPVWPGIAMAYVSQNNEGKSIYQATIPADVDGIIFNNGEADIDNTIKTVDIDNDIADRTMWYPTGETDGHDFLVERVASFSPNTPEPATESSEPSSETPAETGGYYLVSSFTNWGINNAYKLTRQDASEVDEYVLRNVRLTTSDSFKIAYSSDGRNTDEWYPGGMDNSYGENGEIIADGSYDVYFRPNYNGGEDWFYNCIYLVESEQGPQTPDVYVLAGTDNFIPSGWNLGQDSPVMTEGDDGIYSCTVENVVAVENAQYQFKVVQLPGDDSLPIWHGLDGGDQNVAFSLSETCDVTVTYDPDTGEITVSGDGVIEPSTQLSAIYAVGEGKNGFLNNVSWNPAAEANLMTEVADGVYQITYYEIDTDETDPYEFKFAANGDLAVNWGIGSWDVYDVYEADAVLNEDLIYNAGSILFSLENCEDDYVDVTLVLDLSQWDADTQTGAKFSIIVGSEPATEQPTQQPTEPLTEQPTQQPSEPSTEEPYSGEITVYFINALNWDTPYAYYWDESGESDREWPGKAMTFDSQNDYGESVYRVTIPADVYGIIFNANGLQTVEITRDIVDGAMWYSTNQKDGSGYYYVGYVEPSQPSEPLYSINVPTGLTGGSVTAKVNGKPAAASYAGTAVTLGVTPDEGYELDALAVTYGENQTITPDVAADNEYVFNMPAADAVVTAAFRKIQYPVTINADTAYGTVSIVGGQTSFLPGTAVTLSVAPDAGCGLLNLYLNDDDMAYWCKGGSYTFTMPDSAVDVFAHFGPSLAVGENSVFTTADRLYAGYSFVPAVSGLYHFYSASEGLDPMAQLDSPPRTESERANPYPMAQNDDYNGGRDFDFTCSLTAGINYVFSIMNYDGAEEMIPVFIEILPAGDYYLAGTMNNWQPSPAYKLTRSYGEYTLETVYLETNNEFKIVYSEDGETVSRWYPDGSSNYIIENAGYYTIIFRPNLDGGDDWFANCIMAYEIEEPSEEPSEQPSEEPSEQPAMFDCIAVGAPEDIFGTRWDAYNTDNSMTPDENGKYSKTYTVDKAYYGVELKVVIDGRAWIGDENGQNIKFNLYGPGSFTVWVDPDSPVAGVSGDIVTAAVDFLEPDFVLPANIMTIEDSAFDGADMSVVYIPDGCTTIGPNAFRYCASLRQIRIPDSVTSIDPTAFSGCENVTVFGAAPSAAKDIADYYGFVFAAEAPASAGLFE